GHPARRAEQRDERDTEDRNALHGTPPGPPRSSDGPLVRRRDAPDLGPDWAARPVGSVGRRCGNAVAEIAQPSPAAQPPLIPPAGRGRGSVEKELACACSSSRTTPDCPTRCRAACARTGTPSTSARRPRRRAGWASRTTTTPWF